MARKQEKKPVNQETIDKALAKTASEGDIVTFKQLFSPISPLRLSSPEEILSDKYKYMLPDSNQSSSKHYLDALGLAKSDRVRAHVRAQLEKQGPAQLPSELL